MARGEVKPPAPRAGDAKGEANTPAAAAVVVVELECVERVRGGGVKKGLMPAPPPLLLPRLPEAAGVRAPFCLRPPPPAAAAEDGEAIEKATGARGLIFTASGDITLPALSLATGSSTAPPTPAAPAAAAAEAAAAGARRAEGARGPQSPDTETRVEEEDARAGGPAGSAATAAAAATEVGSSEGVSDCDCGCGSGRSWA